MKSSIQSSLSRLRSVGQISLLAAFALLLFASAQAQNSSVVLFSAQGERFHVILNGLRMNETPMTNVKIDDLNQPGYKLKVIFEDPNIGDMDKNLYMQPGEETVYTIKQNRKGDYKLGFVSSAPIATAPPPPPNTQVIHWGAPQVVTTTTVEETVTHTHSSGGTGTGENVSMGVNINGFSMDMNVDINDGSTMNTGGSTVITTTETITTTDGGGGAVIIEEPPCAMMGSSDYSAACNSISSKSFSDSKLTLAKQITRNNCLTAAQIKGITNLFDFESGKLEYAKFAYDYCSDRNNYYQVNDAFDFESSIEELDEYISGR
ncbi:MAG: DUF4476 domain-containing protein [Bacteroidota bacterium]